MQTEARKSQMIASLKAATGDIERGRSTMSDNDLNRVQGEIDEQLEKMRIGWVRLATADFDPEERKEIRDGIRSNEDQLMVSLERKWALRRN
jgi:hypothetical protein